MDHQKLGDLIADADVIIQGYRLRSLERRGFGFNACAAIAAQRGKGIIYLDENCYGPDGSFAKRPGWGQIADAAAGTSYVMGKAQGNPDGQGVLPSLPTADLSTGVISAIAVMSMIRDRAIFGGSWHGHSSLVAYNVATLESWVGLYEPKVVARIQGLYDFCPMTSDLHMIELFHMVVEAWRKTGRSGGDLIADEKFYVHFDDSVFGKDLRILAPVVRYDDASTTPRWYSPPVPFCHHERPRWAA